MKKISNALAGQASRKPAITNIRPSNQENLLVSLSILDMIPKVGKISTSEIRNRLAEMGHERNLRSIQRQLEILSTQFQIERDDSSKPYGYKWRQDAKGLSIPGLTTHESLLLNLAEKYLRNLLPASLTQAMDGFFSQARRNLFSGSDALSERKWLNKVNIVNPTVKLLPAEISESVLKTIGQALFSETWLEIEFINREAKQKIHRVMPLGLVQQGYRLVLVVRFEGYQRRTKS